MERPERVISQTDLECEVSRVLVEAAAVEEREDVAGDLGGEDAVAGERADAAVGEGRRHHRDRLAVHLHRTALRRERQGGWMIRWPRL